MDTADTAVMTHLYTKRKEAHAYNDQIFSHTSSKRDIIKAIDCVSGDIPDEIRNKIISKIPDDPSQTKGLVKCLSIAENLPAELCINVDVTDGMTNGTPCTVKKLDYRVQGSTRCSIIWVQFEESDIGKTCRTKYKHLNTSDILQAWTPILEVTRSFPFNYYKSFHVTRRQFPLQLASAKTVHKSQGSTLPSAVLHLGERNIEHMHYVALSRLRNLSSMHILHLNEKNISVSTEVANEMNRLRSSRKLETIVHNFLFEDRPLSLCFHNCRSLRKHIDDIKNDDNYLAIDVIALCETRLRNVELETDVYTLQGFDKSFNNIEASHSQLSHGIVVYTKIPLHAQFASVNIHGVEVMKGELNQYCNNVRRKTQLFFLYCSPKIASMERFKTVFSELFKHVDMSEQVVVMGDFNIDIKKSSALPDYMRRTYQLDQIIDLPTTDSGTCLDQIYTNIGRHIIKVGTMESYFSDHKPIFVTLPEIA